MGSFGARDAIFPLTLRLEFIEPSTTIVHESSLPRCLLTLFYRKSAASLPAPLVRLIALSSAVVL